MFGNGFCVEGGLFLLWRVNALQIVPSSRSIVKTWHLSWKDFTPVLLKTEVPAKLTAACWTRRPTEGKNTTDLALKHQPASYLRCAEGTSSQRSVGPSLFFGAEHADNDGLRFDDHFLNAVHLVINEGFSEGFALGTTASQLPDDAQGGDANKDDLT